MSTLTSNVQTSTQATAVLSSTALANIEPNSCDILPNIIQNAYVLPYDSLTVGSIIEQVCEFGYYFQDDTFRIQYQCENNVWKSIWDNRNVSPECKGK